MRHPSPGSVRRYRLNLFPVTFTEPTAPVAIGRYVDATTLSELRAAFPSVQFRRHASDDRLVYAWSPTEPMPAIDGYRAGTVALAAEPQLAAAMVRAAVGEHLGRRGLTFLGRGAYANFCKGNYLDDVWPGHGPGIGVHPKILVKTEILEFPEQSPGLFLSVDVAHAIRLDVPVDVLIGHGLAVRDRYVRPRPDLAANQGRRLLGRVVHEDGDDLMLDDTRDGVPLRLPAASCILEESRDNLLAVAALTDRGSVESIDVALRRHQDDAGRPTRKADLITKAAVHLLGAGSAPLAVCQGVAAGVGRAIEPGAEGTRFRPRSIPKPVFSFDPESLKTHTIPDRGIQEHGPYSKRRMEARPLRVLLLAPERFKGACDAFVAALLSGVGDGSVFSGFTSKYRLPNVDITKVYFRWDQQAAKDAYYNAATEALRNDYDLAFIIIREQFHELAPADNPYHVCKVLFLSIGVPVQEITVEKLQTTPYDLQYIVNTVALASYAKLGGTPYVLRVGHQQRQELIFGIGRAIERPRGVRLGPTRQVIGFTTVFGSDGDYLLNSCTSWTDEDNYSRRLEDLVVRSVHEVAAIEGIAEGAALRLIFHVYKRTGRQEREALANVVARLTMYDVEYALLHVNDSHELHLFDPSYSGSDKAGHRDAFLPPRQLAVDIGTRERLVVLMGPRQYRGYGTFSPVRLILDETSTFRDIDYLAHQVVAFSFMSWRGFNPGVLPATILYSELMAEMTKRLRAVLPWNEDIVRTKLQRKLWFL